MAVLMYENAETGEPMPFEEVSAIADSEHDWEGGWRFEDDEQGSVFNEGCIAECPPINRYAGSKADRELCCVSQDVLSDTLFIRTETMELVDITHQGFEYVVDKIKEIDADLRGPSH